MTIAVERLDELVTALRTVLRDMIGALAAAVEDGRRS